MLVFITSFCSLLSTIYICIFEFKNKSLSIMLWAVLLVLFNIPHFLVSLLDIGDFSGGILIKASLFTLLFNLVYFITRITFILLHHKSFNYTAIKLELKSNQSNKITDSKQLKIRMFYFFILLFACIISVIFVSITQFGGIGNISWGKLYNLNKELGFSSLSRYTTYILFGTAGIALAFKYFNKQKMYIISIALIVSYSILTGNRITILPAITALILPFIFTQKSKLTIKKVLLFSFLGFSTVYTVYFLRLFRIYGSLETFFMNFNFSEMNNLVLESLLNGEGELGLRKAFYYFIEINNNFPNFNEGHTYVRLLLLPFPTKLMDGIKPPDFAITMGSAYSNNIFNDSYSMHPTLYGDVFANFYWVGIFLGVFWALWVFLLDKFIESKSILLKIMLIVLFSCVYVIIGRGSVYNGIFIGFSGVLIIYLVNILSRIRFN